MKHYALRPLDQSSVFSSDKIQYLDFDSFVRLMLDSVCKFCLVCAKGPSGVFKLQFPPSGLMTLCGYCGHHRVPTPALPFFTKWCSHQVSKSSGLTLRLRIGTYLEVLSCDSVLTALCTQRNSPDSTPPCV